MIAGLIRLRGWWSSLWRLIATVGYRAATDKYANAPKVRFPKE